MKENLGTRIANVFKPRNFSGDLPIKSLQATSMQSLRDISHYQEDNYDSGYSSIRAIADSYLQIKPYGVDVNGKPLAKTPNAINCLARPNTEMSNVQFRDMHATKVQVYDKVYILVHERDGLGTKPASENVNEDRIAGYTFLEGVIEDFYEGKPIYKVNENGIDKVYFPYQVITDYDTNPMQTGRGYSPSRAAKRWTRIEDYIADYQSGFFENGAVPSGQFIITAPTATEYNDIVDNLEKKHQGAGKNNNVVYTFQPIDPNTGKTAQATITWVPFNTQNKDMALKDILEAVGAKTDSVYRVSAMQRAVTDAPNFATAQVDDRNFVEKTLRPFTLKRYARLQHELNRITGGLGYGITFKLDTPHIAEEEKAKAETNQIIFTTIQAMITAGFTYDSAVKAMKLPANWALLVEGEVKTTVIENDQEDVDQGGEVTNAPPVVTNEAAKRKNPKVTNQLSREDQDYYINILKAPAEALMDKQVERAVASVEPNNVDTYTTDEDETEFLDSMMVIITDILLIGGIAQWEQGRQLLIAEGLEAPTGFYTLSDDAGDRYRKYLKTVFDSYSKDTSDAIKAVLLKANNEAQTLGEIKASLRNIITTDEWRVTRVATTEVNRSGGIASVESMRSIADETGFTLEKSMASGSGSPCQYCATRIGVWFPVDKVMVKKGATINGIDGGIFVNNWDSNDGHDLHANGECYPVYRVVS